MYDVLNARCGREVGRMRWRRGGARGESHEADAPGPIDREAAVRALAEAAAGTGDPGRLHDIALLLWQQFGEVRRAEALLRRATEMGSTPAMSTLGVLLQRVNRPGEAEQWLRLAASSGDVDAINNLGNLLERRGDLAEAVEFWRRAAEAGSTLAMSSLALALAVHGHQREARESFERALLLAASEQSDPAVLGKLALVGRMLESGQTGPERPFPGDRTVQDNPIWLENAEHPVAAVAALHRAFLAGRDPKVLVAALSASRLTVEQCAPGSPEHVEALRIRGSLLRADFERKHEPALLEEAARAGRAAVDGAHDDQARGHAQSSLGSTLLIRHAILHDAAALDQAITALEEARRLLGAENPEWPGITSTLGGALTQQYMRDAQARGRGDPTLIATAIGHLEAAIAATPPRDPELAARQYNLAMARIQLGAVTQDAAMLAQAAVLLRQAVQHMPQQHPARAAAVRMLRALE